MKWDKSSGYLQPGDISLIQRLVGMLSNNSRPKIVVDLGAGSGTTALSVFDARYDDIFITSVDISKEALDATEANMRQYGFIDHWQRIQSRSDRVEWLKSLFVDMLLCDSTHDYASQQDEILVCTHPDYIR